jgi:SHS2 domain-containing protein
MEKTWGLKPHTADIRLWTTGKNLEELFVNSGKALMEYCCNSTNHSNLITREFNIDALDNIFLLIYFLNDLLYLLEVENLYFIKADTINIKNKSLNGVLIFSCQNSDSLNILNPVKAITLHQAFIEKEDSYLKAEFIMDI